MNLIDRMANLDRRWIFLMMGLAVGIPIIVIGITGKTLPEEPTPLAQAAFDVLDDLEPGSRILMAWDFDPASEGELGPMATSFIRQCAQKGHRMYFIALWPVGAQMIRSSTSRVIGGYYPDSGLRRRTGSISDSRRETKRSSRRSSPTSPSTSRPTRGAPRSTRFP